MQSQLVLVALVQVMLRDHLVIIRFLQLSHQLQAAAVVVLNLLVEKMGVLVAVVPMLVIKD
jgi:hypothetical protein